MTQQPEYPSGPAAPPASYPGKTLGIVGLVLAIVGGGLLGLILSIVALVQSKKAGFKNTPALVGVIIGAIVTVIAIVSIIAFVVLARSAINDEIARVCAQVGSGGQITVAGQPYTCP